MVQYPRSCAGTLRPTAYSTRSRTSTALVAGDRLLVAGLLKDVWQGLLSYTMSQQDTSRQ
jgi:hypothetical protein